MAPVTNREVSIRTMWQLEVREGVFIHPAADVAQEMGNKGYDVAVAEALVVKGHQFYKEGRLQDLHLLISDTTTSQVGALMGVILGEAGIPAKWKDPPGDRVETYACTVPQTHVWRVLRG